MWYLSLVVCIIHLHGVYGVMAAQEVVVLLVPVQIRLDTPEKIANLAVTFVAFETQKSAQMR